MAVETQEQQIKQWGDEAHELGRDVGRSAASWCIDGNTHRPWIVETLRMIDEGDPAIDDRLLLPNLSGEWADELSPRRLFEEITGLDAHAEASWNADAYGSVVGALCDAWEAGVSETFMDEIERILRGAL